MSSDLKGLGFIFIDLLNEFPYVIGPSNVLFRKMTAYSIRNGRRVVFAICVPAPVKTPQSWVH